MSTITIYSIILGDDTVFPIDIKETETVARLKQKIKLEGKQQLEGFDAVRLKLYKPKEIHFDEHYLERVQEISQNLGGQESPELHIYQKLSIVGGFPEDMVHIIVVPSAGESINARACPFHIGAERGQWFGQPTRHLEHTVKDSSLGGQTHTLPSSGLACGQHALMRSLLLALVACRSYHHAHPAD